MAGAHQPHLTRPHRLQMGTPMTRLTQPHQIVQPVRIRTATTLDVMDLPHWGNTAMLTHPVTTVEHLPTPLRVHRIPTLPLPANRPHSRKS